MAKYVNFAVRSLVTETSSAMRIIDPPAALESKPASCPRPG